MLEGGRGGGENIKCFGYLLVSNMLKYFVMKPQNSYLIFYIEQGLSQVGTHLKGAESGEWGGALASGAK